MSDDIESLTESLADVFEEEIECGCISNTLKDDLLEAIDSHLNYLNDVLEYSEEKYRELEQISDPKTRYDVNLRLLIDNIVPPELVRTTIEDFMGIKKLIKRIKTCPLR